jgi:ATP-dependent DNA helicase PIF1
MGMFSKKKNFGELTKPNANPGAPKHTKTASQYFEDVEEELKSIEVLPEYLEVKGLLEKPPVIVFITGSAGTGKSTFIKWLDNEFKGRTLVCAPTGVAALTIAGKTIHSLCRFPPSWIVEDDVKFDSKSLAKNAKVLIIDEVSMVNANLLDAMDKYFKINRKSSKPFGGISVVMVGDLFQLPPIESNVTKPLFDAYYESAHFFSAKTIANSDFYAFELTKPFRQKDENFVKLLSNVREGKDLKKTLSALNSMIRITKNPPNGTLSLSPRHADIEKVNAERLAALDGQSRTFEGIIKGKFNEKQLPVPRKTTLKVGAQVMINKNNKEYFNGDVGVLTEMKSDRVTVRLVANSRIVEVPVATWEQFDYEFNPETEQIERIVVGSYSQIPVAPAWAITIHKSQGLTFDRIHIDFGQGAFASGQGYVALSRCRTIEGMSMARQLVPSDIKVDPNAASFYKDIR